MLPTARQMRFWLTASPQNWDKAREELVSIMLKKKKIQHFPVNHKITYIQFGSDGLSLLDTVVAVLFKTPSSVFKLAH